jgi:hypothetical protein
MSRRREERKLEAVERDEARTGRTPEGQLAVLDSRLGKSMGAQRERLRLLREIEKREETVKAKSKGKATKTATSKTRVDRKKAKARRNADRERTSRGDHK